MLNSIERHLFDLTEREQYHKIHPENHKYSDYYKNLETIKIKNEKIYVFDGLIPVGSTFNIVKHTRFASVPTHIHNFIELSYVYSGSCTQIIDGKKVILKAGDVCLVDTAVPHSIEMTSADDIIINILVMKDYFQKQLNHGFVESSIVYDFMRSALNSQQTHNQYIVFRNSSDVALRENIENILIEKYNEKVGYKKIIENLISILFTLLVRNLKYETNKRFLNDSQQNQILQILGEIDDKFTSLSLAELAIKFHYSESYLSTFLKKHTGKTFSQLILDKKLYKVEVLLQNTDLSIQECAEESGFSNLTYFYKKYKNRYNKLPSERDNSRKF